MGEIQKFTEEHAEGVARLYLRAVRGRQQAPPQSLIDYFIRLHLSNPWASPDMPSLVYLDKGRVTGAIGVVPRAMEFRGRPVTLASVSIYMVDPEFRNTPAGIQLLRGVLRGPQDFSWTDGASGSVHLLWSALGGHTGPLYSFNWIRVLRPLGMARLGLDRVGGIGRSLKPASGLLTVPVDLLLSRLPLQALRKPASPDTAKLVLTQELLGCIHQLGWREPLKPHYTAETFPWLMSEAAVNRNLRMMTVSNAKGELTGWFAYYAVRDGASFVLQIGVRGKDDFTNVLLALFQDAWEQGSVCVKGASLPPFLTAMTEQNCFFRHPDHRVVIHSRNPEIVNAIRIGEAAMTRLDGIAWLRFAWEKWDQ